MPNIQAWPMNTIKYLCITALLLFTSACGWHLKGTLEMPADFQALKISGAHGQLSEELQRQLSANGINTSPTAGQPHYSLVLSNQVNERRTAALGADAVVSEYEYLKAIHYELRNPEGKLVGAPGRAELTRSVSYSADNVLSSTGEGTIVQSEMTRELAAQLIRRLSFLIEQSPDGQAAP